MDASARRTAAAASAGTLALLLSKGGESLRGIKLDELVKGADAAVQVQLDKSAQVVRTALASVVQGECAGASAAVDEPVAGASRRRYCCGACPQCRRPRT